jgi:hypothetical protein
LMLLSRDCLACSAGFVGGIVSRFSIESSLGIVRGERR